MNAWYSYKLYCWYELCNKMFDSMYCLCHDIFSTKHFDLSINQKVKLTVIISVNALFFTGNGLSIAVLYRRDMDLKPVFRQILITLISFDCFCVIFNLLVFCFPHLSIYYYDNIFPYAVPYILPLAQIALTGKKIKGKHCNHYQQKSNIKMTKLW